jgi:hypothetical protein
MSLPDGKALSGSRGYLGWSFFMKYMLFFLMSFNAFSCSFDDLVMSNLGNKVDFTDQNVSFFGQGATLALVSYSYEKQYSLAASQGQKEVRDFTVYKNALCHILGGKCSEVIIDNQQILSISSDGLTTLSKPIFITGILVGDITYVSSSAEITDGVQCGNSDLEYVKESIKLFNNAGQIEIVKKYLISVGKLN